MIQYPDNHQYIHQFSMKNWHFSNWNRFLTITKTDLTQDVSNQNKDRDMVITKFSYFIGLSARNVEILEFENWVPKCKLQWSLFLAKKLQWSYKTADFLPFWKITAIFFHFSIIIFIRLTLYKSQTKHANSVIVVGKWLNRPWLREYRLLWLSCNSSKNRFLSPWMVTFSLSKPSISKFVASFYLYLSYEFSIVTFDHISRSYDDRSVFSLGVERSLQFHVVFGKFPKFNFSIFIFFSILYLCKPYHRSPIVVPHGFPRFSPPSPCFLHTA